MYAVIGVSGNTGSAVARTLLDLGKRVRAVVRRPEAGADFRRQGAEIAVADLADTTALAAAFSGVDGVYVMTPPLLEVSDPDGTKRAFIKAIRAAAEQAGAPPLVVLSSLGAHLSSGTGPVVLLHELEQALRDYPGSVSFLRAPYFLDNWAEAIGPATEEGVFPSLITLGVRIDMATTADIGRIAVQLLLEAHRGRRIVELQSSRRYSAQDVALDLARILGNPLEVIYPPRSVWHDILTGAGLSQTGAVQMAELIDSINADRIGFSGEGECRTAEEDPAAMFGRMLDAKVT
ncbi:MAG TPA: NAD(P)H-binding protein [Noviherbaspirillum sp.]|jgi:uncharacterized protein YbjT (DUF2867 family)|uniref:NmrA family NAD(P)-binding protein n=1 Tax=Noviherbaspirillum sp. TaxID=1926288 RepID=UPI002DDC8FEA|nr:NAD(P)H-binding protein [Noviherbaspirillum sp.]HEV2608701.1 NAD(P)H-binding protein [Noviherbaspirillum sp.]